MDIAINTTHRPFAGILFCVLALLLFALQDSIIKYLSERYSVIEILMFRLAIVLILLIVIGVALRGYGVFRSRRARARMLPPWASTMRLQSVSPSPVPPA